MRLERAIQLAEYEVKKLDKEKEQRIKRIGYVEEMNNPHQSEGLRMALITLLKEIEELEE